MRSQTAFLVAAAVISAVGFVFVAQRSGPEAVQLTSRAGRAGGVSGRRTGVELRRGGGAQADGAVTVAPEVVANGGEVHNNLISIEIQSSHNSTDPSLNDASHHGGTSRKYHVVVSTDGNHYTTWQTRIMYYWYLRAREKYPDSDMGGFTRLLHSGQPDDLMEEIPTVVVNRLGGHNVDHGYPVLHRPYAFKQWLEALNIEEDYILMSEPDHLIMRPPPNWATFERPAGYPFTYMDPKRYPKELGQFSSLGRSHISDVHMHMDLVGNAPVIIHKSILKKIVPLWTDLSLKMKTNPACNRAFGWIQEMYAFSLASALVDERPIRYDMHMEFMLQPPWDKDLTVPCWPPKPNCPVKEAYIIHYTYGQDLNFKGEFTPGKRGQWHWDKRDYTASGRPLDIPRPPLGTGDSIVRLVEMINEASSTLWGKGSKSNTYS